jgi:hypothetical protein
MSALDPEIRKYVEEWLDTRIGIALDGKNLANFAAATAQTAFVGINEVRELLENHRAEIAAELQNHREQVRLELEEDRSKNNDSLRAERGSGNNRTRLWVGGMGGASIIVVAVITWFSGRSKAEQSLELERLVDDRVATLETRVEQREQRIAADAAHLAVLERDKEVDTISRGLKP